MRLDIKWTAVFLFVVTFLVYFKAIYFPFAPIDDTAYVINNKHVISGLSLTNIKWAFTKIYVSNWHPVTWLSLMVDSQLLGINSLGYHLTNILLHAINTALLFIMLSTMTSSKLRSAFVAACFALHPLHVESVVWVTERKDVLSGLFCILTILLFSKYVLQNKREYYILSLLSFVLGLMSKPMLVTLPLILLLMDYWPLVRYKQGGNQYNLFVKFISEKIPFIVFSFFSGVVTCFAQRGAITDSNILPIGIRLGNAIASYGNYICKLLWPVNLTFFYPLQVTISHWAVIILSMILLVLSALSIWMRRDYPYIFVGWFWFVITLLPVIGIIQVGVQSMADRYTYIPLIGLFIGATWGFPTIMKCGSLNHYILTIVASAIIVVSAALSWRQIDYWRDDISLASHAILVTSGNYLAHLVLANAYNKEGIIDAEIQEWKEVLKIKPAFLDAHSNLGIAFLRKGDFDSAIKEFQWVTARDPNNSEAHYYLGNALLARNMTARNALSSKGSPARP